MLPSQRFVEGETFAKPQAVIIIVIIVVIITIIDAVCHEATAHVGLLAPGKYLQALVTPRRHVQRPVCVGWREPASSIRPFLFDLN